MSQKEQNHIVSNPPAQTISSNPTMVIANKNNVNSHNTNNAQYLAMEGYNNTLKMNDLARNQAIGAKVGDITNRQKATEYSFPNMLKSNKTLFL